MRVDCIARNVIDQIGLEDYGLISDVDREEPKTRGDDLVELLGVLRCIKDCNSGPLRPVAEHFELYLTLGEAIVDSIYGEPDPSCPGQLFFVLSTESSFALGVGDVITELEGVCTGMGKAFYDELRKALYRWIRVYDDMDARERIEQMTEWAKGEEDPESYEVPNLEQDLPPCLADKQRSDTARPFASFPVPARPWLKELVETTIELQTVSHSMERPKVDEEWMERERHQGTVRFWRWAVSAGLGPVRVLGLPGSHTLLTT